MSYKTVTVVLAADVATSGTFTVTYPSGTNAAWFQKGVKHQITALGGVFNAPEDFGITTFGNTTCTVTWRHSETLPSGTTLRVGLDAVGAEYRDTPNDLNATMSPNRSVELAVREIVLGAPVTADVDGIVIAGSTEVSGTITLDGTVVTDSVAVLDVPRNITVASGGASITGTVLTITGRDAYDKTLIETLTGSASAGLAGVKAFKKVDSIVVSGTSNSGSWVSAGTIGFGDVLGLPVYITAAGDVLREKEDGATASAGTIVAGLATNTASTSTTADVRGTYDPSSACNGTKAFSLVVALADPTFKGNPQYDG